METIDRKKMCILTYPVALEHCADQSLELKEIKAAVATESNISAAAQPAEAGLHRQCNP